MSVVEWLSLVWVASNPYRIGIDGIAVAMAPEGSGSGASGGGGGGGGGAGGGGGGGAGGGGGGGGGGGAESARLRDSLFMELLSECRLSAPGARLNAKLRTALEK